MKLICPDCHIALHIETMGVYVIQTRGGSHKPYKLWKADAYACASCDFGILADFGALPMLADLDDLKSLAELEHIKAQTPELVFYWHER